MHSIITYSASWCIDTKNNTIDLTTSWMYLPATIVFWFPLRNVCVRESARNGEDNQCLFVTRLRRIFVILLYIWIVHVTSDFEADFVSWWMLLLERSSLNRFSTKHCSARGWPLLHALGEISFLLCRHDTISLFREKKNAVKCGTTGFWSTADWRRDSYNNEQ